MENDSGVRISFLSSKAIQSYSTQARRVHFLFRLRIKLLDCWLSCAYCGWKLWSCCVGLCYTEKGFFQYMSIYLHTWEHLTICITTRGEPVWSYGSLSSVNQPMKWDHPAIVCLSVWQPSPAPCCSMLFFPSLGTDDPMFTPGIRAGGSSMSLKCPSTPLIPR